MMEIDRLIAQRRPGHALPQAFYRDSAIFEREVDRLFLGTWQFACHASEIPVPGDYRLMEFASESLIVVRDRDGAIHGLINVCRHRGSRVCLEASGCEQRFVCRYHGWTYGLDGELKGAPYMDEDFDPRQHGLKRVAIQVIEGLVMVHFGGNPVSIEPMAQDMGPCLAAYGLASAKVAHGRRYTIDGNWKLAVENYCECYHCRPSHPEYARAHALAQPREGWSDQQQSLDLAATDAGLCPHTFDKTWQAADHLGLERQHERYPLNEGYRTGSKDGQPLAPLMGGTHFVAAATDLQLGPTLFGLAYSDHVVLYRFLPVDIHQTHCDVSWLVHGKAEEGRDYDLDRLTWLWDLTTQADQRIIENNQKGVNSRFYEPGPFSQMERFADRFVQWYLEVIG